jgi:hypothetical protein
MSSAAMLTAISPTVTAPILRPIGVRTRASRSRATLLKIVEDDADLPPAADHPQIPGRRIDHGPKRSCAVAVTPGDDDHVGVGVDRPAGQHALDLAQRGLDRRRKAGGGEEVAAIVDHDDAEIQAGGEPGQRRSHVPGSGNQQGRRRLTAFPRT